MTRVMAWIQIVIVLCCIAYSTYWLFRGDFDQALIPYPLLIIYYILFSYQKKKRESRPGAGNHEDPGE